jgi:hypothetical protein
MLQRILFIASISLVLACSSDDGSGGSGGGVDSGASASIDGGGGSNGGADAGGNNNNNADAGGNSGGADAGGSNTGEPIAGEVICGSASCDVTGDNVCCVSISGSQCTPADQCGGGFSASQHCDGPEDCSGGKRCCAVFSFSGESGSFCRDTCDTNTAGDEAELCHNNAQCPDSGDMCRTCEFPGAPPTNACAGTDIPACNN